ncbi:MAG: prephenate dehydratase domain-containing protein, partial [Syntrophomonas sp.]|nr:prephenate dehydratase domain-containing protein [Syntrophomonas sp.]
MEAKIAYLGPSGTNCEEAARRIIDTDRGWELVSYASIDAVFAAVNDGRAVRGVVPIENSCEGSVNVTLDLLAYEYQLEIIGEIILPVRHNLLARSGVRIQDISAVLSHPQALAQCRRYLGQHLDGVDCLDIPSTAEAACRVSSSV